MEKLLQIRNLKKYFSVSGKSNTFVKAIDNVTFDIYDGETLGLVGESGCGKSTTGRCILRLIEPTEGEVLFEGKNVLTQSQGDLRSLRRQMQIIFQDPYSAMDPRRRVGEIIGDGFRIHKICSRKEREEKVRNLMDLVGLRPEYYQRFPHEFSGGQRQRIGIARALSLNPKFVVCDEPVSALDVSIQAQVTNLMMDLQERLNLTYLFVSHDLRVIRHISNRVAVMYLGKIVELASKEELYKHPAHPYTQALLSAIPSSAQSERQRIILEGDIPSPINTPSGCHFHTRCRYAKPICKEQPPEWKDIGKQHYCACHLQSN
jgi:oligopeptide transport system ATP-binding protein